MATSLEVIGTKQSIPLWFDRLSLGRMTGGDIQVSLTRQGERAVLRVANDDALIPEDAAAKMFASYYRLPGAPAGGHGLRLAIVKEIADQHTACVRILRKADGQGTVVEV